MDISNIPQNLIKALEQKNSEQLAALSRVLNLVLGKTVMANITSTAPVTPQEREALLKQTAAALTQINKPGINPENLPPAVKAEITRLIQQQKLIESPELKWINLVVNNRPLLAYSNRPLVAGQHIPVQLQSPQKLVLLDLPDAEDPGLELSKSTSTHSPAPVATQLANVKNTAVLNELVKTLVSETLKTDSQVTTQLVKAATGLPAEALGKTVPEGNAVVTKNLPEKSSAASTSLPLPDTTYKPALPHKLNLYNTPDLSPKISATPDNRHSKPETIIAKNILSEQLRHLLPHKDTPNNLLSSIIQLQTFPAPRRMQLVSPSVEQALKSLAEKIRSPEQLAQPKTFAESLKNSGVFFESKLKQLTLNNHTTHKTDLLNATYSQDTKGALLTLLNRVTRELSGKPVSSEQTLKLFQLLNTGNANVPVSTGLTGKNDISQILSVFIQQLMHKPVKELTNKELRTQLLVLLQQHSVHSLAKIQLQQLHSLNHDVDTRETALSSTSLQVEIPVKHHNEVNQVHVRIDRDWVDEKAGEESQADDNTQKVKQWSVTLRFDLPTLGEFCAQLAIINTQVSATLWAMRERTFTEVRDQIESLRRQLESEGINVKYLQCMHGMPPQRPMALSYSLIDIST